MFRSADLEFDGAEQGFALLSAKGRMKFAAQRATLAVALLLVSGAGLGLLAWSTLWERQDGGLVMSAAADLLQTRAESQNDSDLLVATTRFQELDLIARQVRAQGGPAEMQRQRLANLLPIYRPLAAEVQAAKVPLPRPESPSQVTTIQPLGSPKELPLNASADGRMRTELVAEFSRQRGPLDLLHMATLRAQANAPVDIRAAVRRDLEAIERQVVSDRQKPTRQVNP